MGNGFLHYLLEGEVRVSIQRHRYYDELQIQASTVEKIRDPAGSV